MMFKNLEAGPYYAATAYSEEAWPQFTAEFDCVTSPVDRSECHDFSTVHPENPEQLRTNITTSNQRKGSIKMISKLEDALLRCSSESEMRRKIFGHLDNTEMRNLRSVSRVLRDLVEHDPTRLFCQLYLQIPFLEADRLDTLDLVAPFCQDLTITLSERKQAKASRGHLRIASDSLVRGRRMFRSSNQTQKRESRPRFRLMSDKRVTFETPPTPEQKICQEVAYGDWLRILSRMRNLGTITLRFDDSDSVWSGRTGVEDALVTFRTAIEDSAATLLKLKHLRIAPVHAMGIVHLRWNSLSRFSVGENRSSHYSPSIPLLPTPSTVWQNLRTLLIQLRNPFTNPAGDVLTKTQQQMFLKLLHDYLRGFTDTLRTLQFLWLGADGPSPMTLHWESGLEHRPALVWDKLEELWLGNTTYTHRTITSLPELAPKCTIMKLLRRGCDGTLSGSENLPALKSKQNQRAPRTFNIEPGDPSAWVEVLIGKRNSGPIMDALQVPTSRSCRGPTQTISTSSVYCATESLVPSTPPLLTPDHSPEHSPDRSPVVQTPTGENSEDSELGAETMQEDTERNIWGTMKESVLQHQSQGLSDRVASTRSEGNLSRSSRVVPFMLDLTWNKASKRLRSMASSTGLSVSNNNSNEALVVTSL
ncbi:Hypothetical protein R9X50_00161000 [Acrodontium crateriforme]|uniref:F-box domain-containing protein n=1 Tax=Acrodontium crateriforme TaxID=150365 RepID=A0AAQ3R5Y9_9PEZI|nr:Hypothetical protein R9X50_00161000 [Acrodontium crateriforme]